MLRVLSSRLLFLLQDVLVPPRLAAPCCPFRQLHPTLCPLPDPNFFISVLRRGVQRPVRRRRLRLHRGH